MENVLTREACMAIVERETIIWDLRSSLVLIPLSRECPVAEKKYWSQWRPDLQLRVLK